jgi:hypothetical protein
MPTLSIKGLVLLAFIVIYGIFTIWFTTFALDIYVFALTLGYFIPLILTGRVVKQDKLWRTIIQVTWAALLIIIVTYQFYL